MMAQESMFQEHQLQTSLVVMLEQIGPVEGPTPVITHSDIEI